MSKINNSTELQLTTEQELSLRTDRHISVTANAGSGKTFVLVKRYHDIINKTLSQTPDIRIDPSRIVAITFTRKAAAEMYKKVVEAFDDELTVLQNSKKTDFQTFDNLKRIREGLSYASITTIHSFCSNLLRQFPIEAGVPVNFAELSESENLRLRASAITNTLEDWLLVNVENKKEKAEHLLAQFTRKRLVVIISSVLTKAELFDKFASFYSLTDTEISEIVEAFIVEHYKLNDVAKDIIEMSKVLTNTELLAPSKSHTKGYQQFYDRVNDFKKEDIESTIKIDDIANISKLISSFVKLVKDTYTKADELSKNISNWIINDADREYLVSKEDVISEVRKLAVVVESLNNLESFLHISRIMWEFTQDVKKTIDNEKYYLNTLDFDDLQLKVLELLDNKKVVEKIVSQIDYIMIDEFQDTNELQYNIVRKLIPELYNNNTDNGTNLFIVGDAKQSIYGFRNADVRVFNKIIRDILKKNTVLFDNNAIVETTIPDPERTIEANEQLGKNKLSSTFRLRPEIAAFVNIVCSNIMNPNLSSYEVEYTPLVCSKETDKIEIANGEAVKSGKMGKVLFLLSENNKDDNEDLNMIDEDSEINRFETSNAFKIDGSTDSSERPEENLIANYIKSIVGTKLEGRESRIQYKDITILSRKRAKFSLICSELLSQNIPFLVHSGKGFFNTEEINDFINFLKFIYNPNDDISLISILRSPFFNIDDAKILILKKSMNNKSVWHNLKLLSKSDNELSRTESILEEIVSVSSTTSVSKVILLIMEKTGWSGLIAAKPARHQILANIDKFIDIARSYENIGFKNLFDFVDELKFIAEHQVGESEAAILTNENAVNIMTIHASKGLQFPVVILYDTNSRVGGSSSINISEEFALGFKSSIPTPGVFENKVDNILNIINKDIRKKSEQAEAKRVLYVAMTRAEEILAISSCTKVLKNGLSKPVGQLDLILSGLGLTIEELNDNTKIIQNTKLDIRKDKKIIEADYKIEIEKLQYPFINEASQESTEISMPTPIILLDNISSNQNNEYFSPSKILSFNHDENEYFNRFILGLNVYKNTEPENHNNENEVSGKDIGLELHKVLESLAEWLREDMSVDDDLLKQKICSATISSKFNESSRIHQRLFNECKNIAMTPLIQKEHPFIKEGKREFRLSIPIGDNILSGIIDLYFKASSGEYEIWDWKSNLVVSKEEKMKLVKNYELQMMIYSYMFSKLHPDMNTYKAKLLFTRLAAQNAEEMDWTHTFTWSKEDLEQSEKDIENKIKQIRNKLYLWLD